MHYAVLIVLAVFAGVGCKRPADTRMEAFANTVRQTVDPRELQAWASTVISNTPRERLFKEISTNEAPKAIQSLMTDSGTLEVAMDGLSNDVVVVYTRGSGFGHWGFSIGGLGYHCGFGHTQSYWTNGIWFWTE
jgi:hypothetical protein